jgi:hypothetical protein
VWPAVGKLGWLERTVHFVVMRKSFLIGLVVVSFENFRALGYS